MKKSKQYGGSSVTLCVKLLERCQNQFVIITALMSLLMLTSCRNPKNQEQIEQNHPQSKGK
jgi:hypothetical protein